MAEAPAVHGTLTPDDAVEVMEALLPAQNKSYELGLKFKLLQSEVESIHSTYSKPRSRLLQVIIEFTKQTEPRPTWKVIIDALGSPAVSLKALANTVEASLPRLPLVPANPVSTISPESPPSTVNASSSKKVVETVGSEIENLKQQFLRITCDTRALLSEREEQDKKFLKVFVDFVLNFPVAKKGIHVRFFLRNEDEILSAKSIQKLFAILSRYCNYFNYEIIVNIVKEYGDTKLKKRITVYCDAITKFEISTTVDVYLKAILALPGGEICKGFMRMAIKINKSVSECSLHEIRQLKESLAENACVHSYSVYMENVAESSVLVQFLLHPACAEMVYAAITPDFAYLYNVTVEKTSYTNGVTANGAEDQTGDSGMGTESHSALYLIKDFLPVPKEEEEQRKHIYTPVKMDEVQQTKYARVVKKAKASVHQIRSVLTEVVQVLESTKVQEIELAEQVKTILTYNFPPGASEEEEPKALPSIPPRQFPPPLPPRPPDLSSIPPPIPQKKTKTLSSRHSPRSRTVKTIEDFKFLRLLGKGAFSKVVMCREKTTGEILAVKILKKDMKIAHALTESKTLQKISHPFLPSLKYSFQTADRLFLVMECVRGGDLAFHLNIFSEEHARFYGAEIILGIQYLHIQGVVYRHMKLENLMLDEKGHIKIIDFGHCREGMYFGKTTQSFCGDPHFIPPEMLGGTYGREVDWWQLGVAMYVMMTAMFPFYSTEGIVVLFDRIMKEPVQIPQGLSEKAKSLLSRLLEKDPSKRLGTGQGDAEEVKSHVFFESTDWDDLYNKRTKPPFIPVFWSDTSTEYFEKRFTDEDPALTPPPDEGAFKFDIDKYGELFKDFDFVAQENF